MPATRVLAVNMPRFLGGVMRKMLSGRQDVAIVAEAGASDMLAATGMTNPDTVLLSVEESGADAPLAMLKLAFPRMRVVVIDTDGCRAALYEPGQQANVVAHVSQTTLMNMLCGRCLE